MRISLFCSLVLFYNAAFSQINLHVSGDLTKVHAVSFRSDKSEIEISAKVDSNMTFTSADAGIHQIRFFPGKTIFLFVKPNEELDVYYNLSTKQLSVPNSPESADLNKIDAAWEQEVKRFEGNPTERVSKSLRPKDYEKGLLRSYANLLAIIREFKNPEIIDQGVAYLNTLEREGEHIIPMNYFSELNHEFRKQFPAYDFPELATILRNRKGKFENYMWK